MKVVFAGTPAFAKKALEDIAQAGHEIALVLTQPDRARGRGLSVTPGPVKAFAQANGWPILQPESLRLDGRCPTDAACAHDALRRTACDMMVVAAYGLILPQSVLDIPKAGCINIHASLLPRWRGAAPIQRAIEAGDAFTGITIMRMDAGLDTGPMLMQRRSAIAVDDTAESLTRRLADLGGRLVVDALEGVQHGTLTEVPQSEQGVTYAGKITKEETRLRFERRANDLARQIRALYPAPGASAQYGATVLKIWRAQADASESDKPGRIYAADARGIRIGCIEGHLLITELQRPGGQRLGAADFLRGFPIEAGGVFN